MKVSIVILNYNTCELIKQFLPTVIENSASHDVEIVVADNGSTDDSVKWIKTNHPEIRIIELQENLGFAGGYNKALSLIDSELSVLLNSDAAPGKNWLPPLIKAMDENYNTAACVPTIKDYNQPNLYEYAGAAGGFIDRFGYPFCRGRIFNEIEEDKGQYSQDGNIFWASGAALMVRTQLFLNSGGLDKDFFAHMEEIDWCWRIKNQGYQIIYVPKSKVYHLGGGTLNYKNPNKTYLNFRNNLFLILKNQAAKTVFIILIVRLILDLIALLNFIVNKEPQNAKAISRAHRHFFKLLPKYLQKRKQLMPLVTKRHHQEIYRGSIVWDFFMRNKHRFSQLNFRP